MNVKLSSCFKQLVEREIKAGRYKNTGDVICEGLRLLELRDRDGPTVDYSGLGDLVGGDIEALAFLVLMEAAKSAREDLKSIMEGVKAINAAKSALRDLITKVGYDIAENECQRNGNRLLRFAVRGIGSEAGYHRMPTPHPDCESPGGVRRTPTDMHKGPIKHVCVLRAIQDEFKNKLDSMAELGEMESLRLQMAMDRLSTFMAGLISITVSCRITGSLRQKSLKLPTNPNALVTAAASVIDLRLFPQPAQQNPCCRLI